MLKDLDHLEDRLGVLTHCGLLRLTGSTERMMRTCCEGDPGEGAGTVGGWLRQAVELRSSERSPSWKMIAKSRMAACGRDGTSGPLESRVGLLRESSEYSRLNLKSCQLQTTAMFGT